MTESSPAAPVEISLDGLAVVAPDPSPEEPPRRPRSGRPRRHREWREGGTSVHRWGWELFGWAVLALGAGVLGATAVTAALPGTLGGVLSVIVLWLAFAVPVAFALLRSRPRGILRFRPVDILYAVVLGGALRLAQGWLAIAAGGNGGWSSYPSLGGQLPSGWFFDAVISSVIVAPVLEEFFFRVLVLVAVYSAVRRLAGRPVAFFVGTVVSTGLFVLVHALLAPLAWDAVAALSLVGIVASLLVLLTGRIWPAVLVHIVYNGLWVALATIGTVLA